ncbi:MAG: hypothetical protein ACTH6G_07240 [Mesonia sp.]
MILKSIPNSLLNWFGILTGTRIESKVVNIMDSFVLMFLPMKESPHLPPGKYSKSYCFNRPTSEMVIMLVEKLESRGVKFQYNTQLENLHQKTNSAKTILETSGEALAQIYVRSAEDEEIHSPIKMKDVYLAGEVVRASGLWKMPTMKQAAQNVFEYLNVERKINMTYATLASKKGFKLMKGILAELVGISKLLPHNNKEDEKRNCISRASLAQTYQKYLWFKRHRHAKN